MVPARAKLGFSQILKKRFPTIIGLGLLLLGVGAGIFLVGEGAGGFLPRASEDAIPKQVRITNVTDTTYSVSFITDAASPGYVQYGTSEDETNIQVRDDRDQLTSTAGVTRTHHITVRGLQADTQYYFKIGTGSRTLFDNNGLAFKVRTARRLAQPPPARTAYGTIKNAAGNPATGSIVYVVVNGAAPLSSLVQQNGSWAVSLTQLRTRDLSSEQPLRDSDSVQIQVQGERTGELIDITALVSELDPLRELSFGSDNTAATPTPSTQVTPAPVVTPTPQSGSGLGALVGSGGTPSIPDDVVVVYPAKEGETISTTKPEFFGEAPANAYVQIQVHSETVYAGVAQADASGNWKWSPPAGLEPGSHTVTVTYTDAAGKQQSVQRTFIVQANTGSTLPAFVSTPSGTLTSPTPSPSPIALASPTPTPTPTPTPKLSPTPTSLVATSAAQPVSGSTATTVSMFLLGISCIGAGIGFGRKMLRAQAYYDGR